MNELQEMYATATAAGRAGWPAVLATVVRVSGSTYRRPGAKMLATDDGRRIGAISGGCLEADVVRRAVSLQPHEAALVRYDAVSGNDVLSEFGLGCRGVVEVLVERLPPDLSAHPLAVLARSNHSGVVAAVGRVFRAEGGGGVRIGQSFSVAGVETRHDLPGDVAEYLQTQARAAIQTTQHRWPEFETAGGMAEAFIEVALPPLRLLVAGSGHDAIPLASLAERLGWHVTVLDRKAAAVTRARFPGADELYAVGRHELADAAASARCDAAVVMTHNYADDADLLRALLPSPARYVGLLGPKSRAVELLDEIGGTGRPATAEQLARLYAPVGLDIGGDSPEEIALAVVAEIRAVMSGRSGGSLRSREAPIHDPVRMNTPPGVLDAAPRPLPSSEREK